MGIAVLGPLQVDEGIDALARRDRVVLAVLAMRPGELVSADQLADALWAEGPPPTWSKALQGAWSGCASCWARHAIETVDARLPAGAAAERGGCPRVRAAGGARPGSCWSSGSPSGRRTCWAEALALWRGTPLAELEEWEPGRIEAERLEELRRDAEELRVDAALRSGRHREVLADARRLVEQAPLRERRWALLALAQYRAGQQADALRTLQQLRRVLVTELGLDPGPDLVALEQAILRQDPDLLPLIERGGAQRDLPLPGAGALRRRRRRDVLRPRGRGRGVPSPAGDVGVLAVVGPSGSGKSSLVRAGVAAALERDGERVVVVTPGRHPMAALSAVRRAAGRSVLVVDQGEEAVSLCEDPAEVAAFFAALAAHADRGRGWCWRCGPTGLGDLAAHGEMARLVEQGLYLLTPMGAESLRAAIEGPARQAGLLLEPGLVELLVPRWRASRARCRCCPTRCGRPGSAARAGSSPSTATAPPAASGRPWPSRPSALRRAAAPSSG